MQYAHGTGGAKDLPVPLELTVAGAVAALVISFTVLAVAWRSPRYGDAGAGRPAPGWLRALVDAPAFRAALRVFGLVLLGFTAMCAIFGQNLERNPVIGIFYVWLWVGVVWMSLLVGPFWRAISPVRAINWLLARLTGGDPDRGLLAYPAWLGYWPAALGLYAFAWMELVQQTADVGQIRLWCTVYLAVMLIGGALFGSGFYERADPFEVYSTLASRMSVWARRDDDVLVVRSPLANVATTTVAPGLVGVVGVLFGSTAFDPFSSSPRWITFIQGSSVSRIILQNLGLLGFVLAAVAILVAGSMLTGVGPGTRRRDLPEAFAVSIIPIVVGYVIAHYLSFFVEVGSDTLIYLSDPFSDGSNWFGTADLSPIDWWRTHQQTLAVVKVAAVVTGHVLGAVVMHDRALHLLPRRHQITGQLPMLLAMVALTVGGLYLLFAA